MKARLILTSIAFVLTACSEDTKTELPRATYRSLYLDKEQVEQRSLRLSQKGIDSVVVEYATSLVVALDSNLHYNAESVFLEADRLHSFRANGALLFFDKHTPWSAIRTVKTELAKVTELAHVFMVSETEGIQMVSTPFVEGNEPYIHPKSLWADYPLPPSPPIPSTKELLDSDNGILLRVKNDKVSLSSNGNPVLNLDSVITYNDRYAIVYEMNDENTYQDFITAIDYVFSCANGLRDAAIKSDSISTREAKRRFPIRMVERND
jgi:hypothetical protein